MISTKVAQVIKGKVRYRYRGQQQGKGVGFIFDIKIKVKRRLDNHLKGTSQHIKKLTFYDMLELETNLTHRSERVDQGKSWSVPDLFHHGLKEVLFFS